MGKKKEGGHEPPDESLQINIDSHNQEESQGELATQKNIKCACDNSKLVGRTGRSRRISVGRL
ncbi:MAG: hypothetical protein OEU59_12780, partial [Gammaproteobacteria bacterium]|nr:hypothetical protein [Gammaproteobacteria bacterium]